MIIFLKYNRQYFIIQHSIYEIVKLVIQSPGKGFSACYRQNILKNGKSPSLRDKIKSLKYSEIKEKKWLVENQ
jgi:hypothetical protein